ncbi:hypothetical protein CBL_13281 [Carabus blaptoides fortunei]
MRTADAQKFDESLRAKEQTNSAKVRTRREVVVHVNHSFQYAQNAMRCATAVLPAAARHAAAASFAPVLGVLGVLCSGREQNFTRWRETAECYSSCRHTVEWRQEIRNSIANKVEVKKSEDTGCREEEHHKQTGRRYPAMTRLAAANTMFDKEEASASKTAATSREQKLSQIITVTPGTVTVPCIGFEIVRQMAVIVSTYQQTDTMSAGRIGVARIDRPLPRPRPASLRNADMDRTRSHHAPGLLQVDIDPITEYQLTFDTAPLPLHVAGVTIATAIYTAT